MRTVRMLPMVQVHGAQASYQWACLELVREQLGVRLGSFLGWDSFLLCIREHFWDQFVFCLGSMSAPVLTSISEAYIWEHLGFILVSIRINLGSYVINL